MRQQFSLCAWLTRLFSGIFFVLLTYMTLSVCQNTGNFLLYLLSGLGLAAGVIILYRSVKPYIDKISLPAFRRILFLFFALYFVLLIYLGWQMRVYLRYDMEIVYNALPDFLADGRIDPANDYFVLNPNNIGLLLLLGGIYKIAGLFGIQPDLNGMAAGIFTAALGVLLTVILLCLIARLIFNSNSGVLLLFLLSVLFVPFYLWIPYFYTATLSLVFPVFAVYAYLRYRRGKGACSWIWLGCAALSTAVGYAIKGNIMVMTVAVLLALLFDESAKWLKRLLACVVFGAVVFGSLGVYQAWQRSSDTFDFSNYDAVQMPLEVWFCFGSHGTGNWDMEDRVFAQQFPTVAEKKAALRARIAQNYASYTPQELHDFLHLKLMKVWGDGKFGAQDVTVYPQTVNWTQNFVFEQFFAFKILSAYAQAFLVMLYALICVNLFQNIRKPRGQLDFLLHLNLFGTMLFLSVWEVSASYLFNYTPLLLLTAGMCIMRISEHKKEPTAMQ